MTQTVDNLSTAPEAWVSLAPQGFSRYEISTIGRIRTHRYIGPDGLPVIMRPALSGGYLAVALTSDAGVRQTAFIHRIACAAWNGAKPTPGHCASHNNDIKTDNRPGNLTWATRAENNRAAYDNGCRLRGANPKSWTSRATLSVSTVRAMRARYNAGQRIADIAVDLGTSYYTAYNAIKGITYNWVGADTAESHRIENAALAAREASKAAVAGERDRLYQEALERAAPPPRSTRRKAQHTPAASAPRSKGAQ